MQNPLPELYIAERQAEREREIQHDKLVREAEKGKAPRPDFIANILHALSVWMIRKGKRMHKRYHSRSNAGSY
jgi:hypothetical protein